MTDSKRSASVSAIDWKEQRDSIDEIARRLNGLLLAMADVPTISAPADAPDQMILQAARCAWNAARERRRLFGSAIKSDPGWDLLLELFIAAGERRKVTVASASLATGLDETTVLRCIVHLADAKFVVRHPQSESDDMCLALSECAIAMISEFLRQTMKEAGAAAA